jgi:short-subunit dehydrogenase
VSVVPRAGLATWKNPRTILITGATGGIGTALALNYAASGRVLLLHGRDPVRLAALAQGCETRGAKVEKLIFDLREAARATEELQSISRRFDIDLIVLSAGVTKMIGDGAQVESLTEAREVLSVNLEGALASIASVLPDMRRRSRGQIAIVSSMAAYMGIAQAPVYGASKAALKTYGEALRAWLRPQGIAVSVVLLGFVRTRMTEQFRGPKPMLVSPETAARCIRRGLERNRARILCPRALGWGLLWLSVLPSTLAERIMRTFGYRS